jgi:hypothetical protein
VLVPSPLVESNLGVVVEDILVDSDILRMYLKATWVHGLAAYPFGTEFEGGLEEQILEASMCS